MRTSIFLVCSAILHFATNAQSWVFDDAHSNLQFSITNLMVTEIEGSIRITEASLLSKGDDFADAIITIKGDMSTIDTDQDDRDASLRSPDFFDVAKYPNLTFHSLSFTKLSDTKYVVKGNLTFHGMTKPVSMDVTANTAVRPWDEKTIVGFKASAIILRSDFGIATTTPTAILSDEVQVRGNVIFVKE